MSEAHVHEVNPRTIRYLLIAFIINLLLTAFELGFGFYADSIALIGDALHNTSDAFSILIALIAYKIGTRKATDKYSYGFKRAETIGGFVNLILLFIAGLYLLYEGIFKIINPEQINGRVIIVVSVLALVIDLATAKLSHQEAGHNTNMKMLFLHNFADAMGSVGVIISGLCVIFLGWNFVDGMIAVLIAVYMIVQSVLSFPEIVNILMNAAPKEIDVGDVRKALLAINGVCDVHHVHLWYIDEGHIGMEAHIVGKHLNLVQKAQAVLLERFQIEHANIQLEADKNCKRCCPL